MDKPDNTFVDFGDPKKNIVRQDDFGNIALKEGVTLVLSNKLGVVDPDKSIAEVLLTEIRGGAWCAYWKLDEPDFR